MLVAVAALVILVPVLELWDADLDIPLAYTRGDPGVYTYEPDAPFYQMLAKGGIDNVWFFTNPDLGAPFHQQLFDFPVGLDNLNLVGLKVLGTVTGDVGATVNIFYVLTFVAVAVSMLLVLRALGVSRGRRRRWSRSSTRSFRTTSRAAYRTSSCPRTGSCPLAAYLVLRVASARPPFTTERGPTTTGWRVRLWDKSGLLWLLACVAIASSGAYYAAFTLLFLVVLGVVDFIARRRRRVLASAAIAIAAIGVVAAINLAPTFVYMAVHGQDAAVVRRTPSETEFEGLKISQLVLPVEQHRIQALADVQTKSTKYTPTLSERGQQLGFIGALGFAGLLVALLVAIRRDRRGPPPEPTDDEAARARADTTARRSDAEHGRAHGRRDPHGHDQRFLDPRLRVRHPRAAFVEPDQRVHRVLRVHRGRLRARLDPPPAAGAVVDDTGRRGRARRRSSSSGSSTRCRPR